MWAAQRLRQVAEGSPASDLRSIGEGGGIALPAACQGSFASLRKQLRGFRQIEFLFELGLL
jgi:hypothetical protein